MSERATPLERAFELAASGACRSIDEIKARLKREGYDVAQLTGRTLADQLRNHIKQAQEDRAR